MSDKGIGMGGDHNSSNEDDLPEDTTIDTDNDAWVVNDPETVLHQAKKTLDDTKRRLSKLIKERLM